MMTMDKARLIIDAAVAKAKQIMTAAGYPPAYLAVAAPANSPWWRSLPSDLRITN